MKTINKNSILIVLSVFSTLGFGLVAPMTAFAAGPAVVNLGTAGNFAILAETGISTTGSTAVVGNIGVSPAAATYITGFGLTLPAAGAFATSPLVSGDIYAPDYATPTPTVMTTAVSDMQTAYVDAAGRTNPTATELGAGNIGGLTLAPGLYKWSTGVIIPANVTLSGGPNDVWIFQIAQNLNVSSGVNIILSGGAQASNVFWVVAGQTTIGTMAVVNGNIMDQTSIVLNTGAALNGRALAQAAVTLDANTVTTPSGSSVVVVPPPTPAAASSSAPTTVYTSPATSAPTTVTQSAPNTNVSANASEQAELNVLLGNLQTLQAEAAQQTSQIQGVTTNLSQGSRGTSVATLQQFLIGQNKGPAAQALANAGATAYFGTLTRAALAEFQANVGIGPALGNFGAVTRAYIGAHY